MFGLFNRNPEAGAPGQPQNVFLTQKFIAYSLMSYTAAAWSLHYCVTTSFSYLHAMTKITEGIHAMIWGNLFLLNSVLILKGVIHMLFGQLRLIEYEHILEQISYTVITLLLSCSSMNGLISVMQIHCVLFVCCRTLHWILKDRMEVTFQANDMRLTLKDILLSRFMFNLLVLTAVDGIIVAYYVNKILYKSNIDVTYTLFIISQYAILGTDLLQVILRTGLNLFELSTIQNRARIRRNADHHVDEPVINHEERPNAVAIEEDEDEDEENAGLEGKFIYEKLIDVFISTVKVIIKFASSFSTGRVMMVTVLWEAITTFKSARGLWKNWKSSKSLDASLMDATDIQIESGEIDICIVCMEDFLPSHQRKSDGKKVKILPCTHALHLSCLKNWIARSPTCPICRLPIFDENGNVMPYQDHSQSTDPNTTAQEISPGIAVETNSQTNINTLETTNQNITLSPDNSTAQNLAFLPTRNTSLIIPIQREDEHKHKFKILTESGKEIEGSLILRNNIDTTKGSVVLPQDLLIDQDASQLKRKIADLESKLEELSKKVKRE